MSSDVVIRAAAPTIDEGRLFGRYVLEITEGLFRFILGPQPEEIIAATYVHPGNDMSYKNTVFAEIDGVVVGMASGYTAEEHHEFSHKALTTAAGRRALRVAAFGLLLSGMFRALDTHEDGDFYLHYVGVDGSYRGRGIGSTLLTAMEERARNAGSRRFSLDVAAKNTGAIGLYKRFGLDIEYGWPRARIIPNALYRMIKEL